MLPDGVRPLAEIKREENIGNKIMNLASLLDYLMKFFATHLDGQKLSLGEKIKANEYLFSNCSDVFFAIGVRNYFAHPNETTILYTEAQKQRAATHLIRAIEELCGNLRVPRDKVSEILKDRLPTRQEIPVAPVRQVSTIPKSRQSQYIPPSVPTRKSSSAYPTYASSTRRRPPIIRSCLETRNS